MIRLLSEASDLEKYLVPILEQNGLEVPPAGCYVAAVEFNDAGEVIAYQMLQNALFLEGMWSRDGVAHLLSLHNAVVNYAEGLGAKRLMTMTRQDKQGEKIGKLAQRLGYELMPWNVYRKKAE